MDPKAEEEFEKFKKLQEELEELCSEAQEKVIRSREIVTRSSLARKKAKETRDQIQKRRAGQPQTPPEDKE